MKILIAGFEGDNNSSKILLDLIKMKSKEDIVYLKNDFKVSTMQIKEKLVENYDYILIFGQKPNTNSISLENSASLDKIKLDTDYWKLPMQQYIFRSVKI